MKKESLVFKYDDSINEILDLTYDFTKSRLLFSACELDVFTIIGDGKKTAEEIAVSSGANKNSMERLLNALCSINLLEKSGGFYTNPQITKEILVKGKPNYLSFIPNFSYLWDRWSKLTESIIKGEPVDFIDLPNRTLAQRKNFIEDMNWRSVKQASDVAGYLDFSNINTILDIGGGAGAFTMEFLRKKPSLEITIFDLPEITDITREYLSKEGFLDKVKIISGDYKKDNIGGPYNMVFLSQVLHLNSIWENIDLVKKIYFSLSEHGIIVINDYIINEVRTFPTYPALYSLNLLVDSEHGDICSNTDIWIILKESWFEKMKTFKTSLDSDLVIAHK
jgi:hypothetical protein